jgi:hypothetical protein
MIIILKRDARANDVAQDQRDKKSKRAFNPPLKKRIRTQRDKICNVNNKENKWAKYP